MRLLFPLCILTAFVLACSVHSVPAADAPARPAIVPVAEVKPGMKGYGLTAFQGSKVEKFDVEVLGVIRGWSAQGAVVLVKLTAPPLEQAGVIAGMSGSPIYIGDRLLGAVAYGFYFTKIPLAGVTPAEEMFVARELDHNAPGPGAGAKKAALRDALRARTEAALGILRAERASPELARERALKLMLAPLAADRRAISWGVEEMPENVRPLLAACGQASLAPLPVPLAVGGIGRRDYESVAPLMMAGGFMPVQGGAAASPGGPDEAKIEPGAPVGAILMSGDIDLSGMGTLTAVDGDRVLAFGHPMFGSGETNLPLAVGRVEAIVPSSMFSFRLSSTGRVIGRLTQDRDSAIVGRLGEQAPTFPCTVRVQGARDTTFHYSVAGHWQVSPMLAFYAAYLSAVRWEGEGNLMTMKATSRISLKGREKPIVLQNLYAEQSLMPLAFAQVMEPMQMLTLNPFQDVEITGLDLDLKVEQGFQLARVESVRVDRTAARPGEKVIIWITLRQFHGPEQVRKMEIEVPRDALPGTTAEIQVCDSFTARMMDISHDPGFFDPKDMEGLIANIEKLPPSTHLYVRGSFVKRGLRYKGLAMPALPSSATSIIVFGTESGQATPLVEDVKTDLETPWVVVGGEGVAVVVKKPYADASLSY